MNVYHTVVITSMETRSLARRLAPHPRSLLRPQALSLDMMLLDDNHHTGRLSVSFSCPWLNHVVDVGGKVLRIQASG